MKSLLKSVYFIADYIAYSIDCFLKLFTEQQNQLAILENISGDKQLIFN